MLDVLGFDIQQTTTLESITQDVVRSSEIEGERLNMDSVRSSIARHLGVEKTDSVASDHYTEGVVQVELDAVQNCNEPLTKERLCDWHAALFPTGRSGMYKITVADWRQGEDPMLIVSGAVGKERVRDAIETSELRLDSVLKKAAFWNSHAQTPLNERQRKIINRLFDGFDGPLTSSKWAKICECSPDTALRDINDLIGKGILAKSSAGGRSTHYELG